MKVKKAIAVDDAARPRATRKRAPISESEADALRDGARSLQFALERGLQIVPSQPEPNGAPAENPELKPAAPKRATTRRLVKIALGLALVMSLGWSPLRTMLATTSVEALVNARVETIRSPIEGVVESAPDATQDWSAGAAPPRLRIVDPLADHSRLDDLRRQYETLESQAGALARQSELAAAALQTLTAQVESFRDGRIRLLDARIKAQTADLEAAAAKASQTAESKRRTDELRKSGAATAAEGDRTQYEWVAATSAESAAAQRLEETKIELDAVKRGVFIGDSYNDSPSSVQRAAELRLRVGEVDAQAAAARAQMKLLAVQIAEEEARYRERSDALVVLPAAGRVWEMLTAPGERVGKGQDLMRVLDCSHPIVSANVDENVYDRLVVGGPATFRPLPGGGKAYAGTIVNLTGAAGASGNFAIPPAAMRKSPFYVTVAVKGMSEGGCSVGRTGTVTFGKRDAATANESVPLNSPGARESAPLLRPAQN